MNPTPPMTPPPMDAKPPHPLDLLPPSNNRPVFEDGQQLRHIAQNRSPFMFGADATQKMQQGFQKVSPWLRTINSIASAYMGLPTVDFSKVTKRPAFTSGYIGSAPTPTYAAAAMQDRMSSGASLAQAGGLSGVAQQFAGNASPGGPIPYELMQEMPNMVSQLQQRNLLPF